jgi:hypothetical protein
MDNIRAAMIVDRGMSPLEEEVRQKAVRAVVRMCPDHEVILAALGLVRGPEPEQVAAAPCGTCKRGHPRTPENMRRHKRGWRCKACERHTHAERVARKRELEGERPPRAPESYSRPRPKDRSTRYDVARNLAMQEARALVGLSWGEYRAVYGVSWAVALAVVAAAGDPVALEALKKENR